MGRKTACKVVGCEAFLAFLSLCAVARHGLLGEGGMWLQERERGCVWDVCVCGRLGDVALGVGVDERDHGVEVACARHRRGGARLGHGGRGQSVAAGGRVT